MHVYVLGYYMIYCVELMDDSEGGKPAPLVPQLRVFRDVAGYCGVSVMCTHFVYMW